jgi:5-methylcytosine-specific restriction endonuclease McrA
VLICKEVIIVVLQEATLVLNKNWTPIGFGSVGHAIELMAKERAEAILPDDYSIYDFESLTDLKVVEGEKFIKTVSLNVKVPEVIRLNGYGKIPQHRLKLSRRNLFRRDKCSCQYCGRQLKSIDATIDHVIPKAQGGKTNWKNCVISCLKCNNHKGNRTPKEARMQLIKQPVEPHGMTALRIPLFKKKVSWHKFVSDAYWDVELDED